MPIRLNLPLLMPDLPFDRRALGCDHKIGWRPEISIAARRDKHNRAYASFTFFLNRPPIRTGA
jgi:hypothetical protein